MAHQKPLCLTLVLAAFVVSLVPTTGQTTLGALTRMAVGNTVPLVQGAGNMLTSLTQPNVNSGEGTLPQCLSSNVLFNAGGFPTNWAQLKADQQAAHPINMVMFQLGYAVYQTPGKTTGCLGPMGVDTYSIKMIFKRDPFLAGVTAFVMKAAHERIFVLFRGSTPSNVWTDASCRYSEPVGAVFGAPGQNLRMHNGFYSAWQALEPDVVATVKSYLATVPSGKVYVIGHSLGASLASIAALRLNTVLPKSAEVAGVWLLASPRSGNAVWADVYNKALLAKTLRFNNYKDFAVRLPRQIEECSAGGVAVLLTETNQYSHVGRSLLMCPAASGLTQWNVYPAGSERTDCGPGQDGADTSGATHLLGSYFDAWRRGYLASYGSDLAKDRRTAAVVCEQCTDTRLTRLLQANVPARAGGPVTCFNDAACQSQKAWDATTAVAKTFSAVWGPLYVCNGFLCSDPGV